MQRKTYFPNKKPALFLLMLALPLMAMFPWKVKRLQEYFPMEPGSWRQYNYYNIKDAELMIDDTTFCTADTLLNGKRYTKFFRSGTKWIMPAGFYRFEKAVLYRFNANTQTEVIFADFSRGVNAVREFDSDTVHYTVKVLSKDTLFRVIRKSLCLEAVSVRVKCDTVDYSHTWCEQWTYSNKTGDARFYFQRGVGLVGVEIGRKEVLYLNEYGVKKK